MRRTLATFCLLAVAGFWTACGGDDNANSTNAGNANNATRNGVVETNANISRNASGNTVPSNTAVGAKKKTNDKHPGGKTTNRNNNKTREGNKNNKAKKWKSNHNGDGQ